MGLDELLGARARLPTIDRIEVDAFLGELCEERPSGGHVFRQGDTRLAVTLNAS